MCARVYMRVCTRVCTCRCLIFFGPPRAWVRERMFAVPRARVCVASGQAKYGVRVSSGGGRSSARETIARVAAGAIAEKWLLQVSRRTAVRPRQGVTPHVWAVQCPHPSLTSAHLWAVLFLGCPRSTAPGLSAL